MSKAEFTGLSGNGETTGKIAGVPIKQTNDDWLLDAVPGNSSVVVRLKRTYNLGDYESMTIGVDLSIPCGETEAERNAAFDTAFEWCRRKIADHSPKSKKG